MSLFGRFEAFKRYIFGNRASDEFDSFVEETSSIFMGRLQCRHRLSFTIYFADGGYVIQTVPIDESSSKVDESKIYIATDFDKIGEKVKEIVVNHALRKGP